MRNRRATSAIHQTSQVRTICRKQLRLQLSQSLATAALGLGLATTGPVLAQQGNFPVQLPPAQPGNFSKPVMLIGGMESARPLGNVVLVKTAPVALTPVAEPQPQEPPAQTQLLQPAPGSQIQRRVIELETTQENLDQQNPKAGQPQGPSRDERRDGPPRNQVGQPGMDDQPHRQPHDRQGPQDLKEHPPRQNYPRQNDQRLELTLDERDRYDRPPAPEAPPSFNTPGYATPHGQPPFGQPPQAADRLHSMPIMPYQPGPQFQHQPGMPHLPGMQPQQGTQNQPGMPQHPAMQHHPGMPHDRDDLQQQVDSLNRLMSSDAVQRMLELMKENVELKAQMKIAAVELQLDRARHELSALREENEQLRREHERAEREHIEREHAERELAEREHAEREHSERERAEREHAERERVERENAEQLAIRRESERAAQLQGEQQRREPEQEAARREQLEQELKVLRTERDKRQHVEEERMAIARNLEAAMEKLKRVHEAAEARNGELKQQLEQVLNGRAELEHRARALEAQVYELTKQPKREPKKKSKSN